jgi:hypothetical protein
VKFSTAVGHLVEMADVATDRLRLRDTSIGWPLEELWVAGELLDLPTELEAATVVLAIDAPPDEVPWLAKHPAGEWAGSELRLGKRPFFWAYRPSVWPVWNHQHRRVARVWSAAGGADVRVLDALRRRDREGLQVVEPSDAELAVQLRAELGVSRRHLRHVLDHYWDRDWRRSRRGLDDSAEDELWRAAEGAREIVDALAALG